MRNQNDYALVVGIKDYLTLPVLEGPHEDATHFKQWLITDKGGDIPENNCKLILSEQNPSRPLQDDIDAKFGEIFAQLNNTQGRRLYIYFSGHGLGVDWQDVALVLPKWSDTLRNYALSSDKYLEKLVELGYFSEIFFFMDCCRNRKPGAAGANPYFGGSRPADLANCQTFVCFAAEFDNPAYEVQNGNGAPNPTDDQPVRGLFTVALLNGLQGGAVNASGNITLATLQNYLVTHLTKMAESRNKSQQPRFSSTFSADKVIIGTSGLIDLSIKFTTPGRTVIIEDAALNQLQKGVSNGQPWTLQVPRGLYSVRYEDNSLNKFIRIDGTQNPFEYEF